MAATEVETPVKMCLTAIEKKVRNLEKRKSKLDSYRDKSKAGEELNKDQKEAVAKYDVVLQNLDFARDLLKQFQSISNDVEKLQRKQAKRDKVERQQTELTRFQDLLQLQTLLDSLGDDTVRARLRHSASTTDVVVSEENLTQLDEFYQLIAPSRDETEAIDSFNAKLASAAEHIQMYLDRSDRCVVGFTYRALHDLVDQIHSSPCLLLTRCPLGGNNTNQQAPLEPQAELTTDNSLLLPPSLSTTTTAEHVSSPSAVDNLTSLASTVPCESTPSSIVSPSQSYLPNLMPQGPVSPHLQSAMVTSSSYQQPWSTSHLTSIQSPQQRVFETTDDLFGDPKLTQQQLHELMPRQRPLQDIVSSMQGSYHFLQESQIDLDNQLLLSSIHPSTSAYMFSQNSSVNSGVSVNQFVTNTPTVLDHRTSMSSPLQFVVTDPLFHQPTSSSFYSGHQQQQHGSPAGFSFTDPHQGAYSSLVSAGSEPRQQQQPQPGAVVTLVSEEQCPAPIPLPSEVTRGQSLTFSGYETTEQFGPTPFDKKQFAMNPNADVFRSVYEPATAVISSIQSHLHSSLTATASQLPTSQMPASQTAVVGTVPPAAVSSSDQSFAAALTSSNNFHGNNSFRGQQSSYDPSDNNGFTLVGRPAASGAFYNSSRGGNVPAVDRGFNSHRGGSSHRSVGRGATGGVVRPSGGSGSGSAPGTRGAGGHSGNRGPGVGSSGSRGGRAGFGGSGSGRTTNMATAAQHSSA